MKISPAIAAFAARLAISGCVLTFFGCINDRFTPAGGPISFESSISGLDADTRSPQTTRASNADWHSGDSIGVYMMEQGGSIADNSLAVNALYRHSDGGDFVAQPGEELYYPRVGSVDFVAYYPWRPTRDDHRYLIDVADQSNHPAIDFIFSDNAKGHSPGNVPLLEFHHMLSKLVFRVRDLTEAPLDELEAVITGLNTRGVFDLSEGGLTLDAGSRADIVPASANDGDDDPSTALLEAIALPGTGLDPAVDFKLDGGSTARLSLPEKSYLGGRIYIYNVDITAPAKVVLTGGTVIVDWDDRDSDAGDYRIPKTDPDDRGGDGGGDDPGDGGGDPGDGNDPPGPKEEYFLETLGNGGGATMINEYRGWDSPSSVNFSDRFGGAVIGGGESGNACISFPRDTDVDLRITGLPAGYSDITLSYDIASDRGGVRAGIIMIYTDAGSGWVNHTSKVTATISSPDSYTRVSIDIPDGTTSLRFTCDGSINTVGMSIDNIRLEGRKPRKP